MSKKTKTPCIKPLSAAIGAAFVTSLAMAPAMADENPFGMADLSSGYMVAGNPDHAEGKCGEGKCGEGKCGADKMMAEVDADGDGMISAEEHAAYATAKFEGADTDGDGMVSAAELDAAMKAHEGKCGEGKCGEDKGMEGSCGEGKSSEGSCGEGKSSEGSCGGRA